MYISVNGSAKRTNEKVRWSIRAFACDRRLVCKKSRLDLCYTRETAFFALVDGAVCKEGRLVCLSWSVLVLGACCTGTPGLGYSVRNAW